MLPTPVVAQPTWTATASHNPQTAPAALTGGLWSTGGPQQAGMWFQLELPSPMSLTEIQFDSPGVVAGGGRRGRGGAGAPPAAAAPGRAAAAPPQGFGGGRGFALPPPGFPRGYTVEVSTDGSAWTQVATGQGDGGTTVITFKPVSAKFVKITQTSTVENAPAWSIQRLRLYQPPKAVGTR
jgi:hypothetical protein